MLTIRKEQMDAFERHVRRKYEDRVIARIAKVYPEQYKQDGEEKTRYFVKAGIEKSEKHGIEEDDDAERFILLLFAHGLDFDNAPDRAECRQILDDKDLPGDAKVSLLYREFEPPDSSPEQPADSMGR
jgi:hypothetical protein